MNRLTDQSQPVQKKRPANKALNRSGGWTRIQTLNIAGRRPVSMVDRPER